MIIVLFFVWGLGVWTNGALAGYDADAGQPSHGVTIRALWETHPVCFKNLVHKLSSLDDDRLEQYTVLLEDDRGFLNHLNVKERTFLWDDCLAFDADKIQSIQLFYEKYFGDFKESTSLYNLKKAILAIVEPLSAPRIEKLKIDEFWHLFEKRAQTLDAHYCWGVLDFKNWYVLNKTP